MRSPLPDLAGVPAVSGASPRPLGPGDRGPAPTVVRRGDGRGGWAGLVLALRRVLPFAAAASAAPVTSLWAGEPVRAGVLASAFAVMAVVTVAMVAVLAVQAPVWAHDVCVLGSFVGLALVVDGAGGAENGLSVILLVPVVWMALYGRLPGLVLSVVVETVGVVSLAAADPAGVSRDDVRYAVVVIAVSAFTAATVYRLVRRVRRSETRTRREYAVLASVAAASRALRDDPEARTTVCRAVLDVCAAGTALLVEPDGPDHLRVTASAGTVLPAARIPMSDPSIAVTVYRDGRALFVPDSTADARVNPTLVALTKAGSLYAQPVRRAGQVTGVVIATWPARLPSPDPRTVHAMALLAEEIGAALERADLRAQLRHEADTDPLTGLANRRVWRTHVPDMLATGDSFCVAILDLDRFKSYNDTHGHLPGDVLLRQLAHAWQPLLRPGDLLVRWGGEEFALALPNTTPATALAITERLRAAVPGGQTVSAGVACRGPQETLGSLLARADAALYHAKTSGRDRAVLADPLPPLAAAPHTRT